MKAKLLIKKKWRQNKKQKERKKMNVRRFERKKMNEMWTKFSKKDVKSEWNYKGRKRKKGVIKELHLNVNVGKTNIIFLPIPDVICVYISTQWNVFLLFYATATIYFHIKRPHLSSSVGLWLSSALQKSRWWRMKRDNLKKKRKNSKKKKPPEEL